MSHYSIKDLERLSGIKAHTIRIWEQRYGIVQPQRTATNIRYYNDDDLRRILNIALLNQNNVKISHIAGMNDEQIHAEVSRLTATVSDLQSQIDLLGLCMMELDEERLETVMDKNIEQHGFEQTMTRIVFPFLEKIGNMWMTGTIHPAHEHFISNVIRQKLISAIDAQPKHNNSSSSTFMLFCPEEEYHELGLLFMNYLLRSREHRTIYLGAAVPFADLKLVYERHLPDYLFTYITMLPVGWEVGQYIQQLADSFPQTSILVAGRCLSAVKVSWPKNVRYFQNVDASIAFAQNPGTV